MMMLSAMACKHETDINPGVADSNITFADLKVGQKNSYLYLIGENYYDAKNIAFEYTADTLVHEIIGADENGFLVNEYLTPGSLVFDSEDPYIYNAWDPYQFYIKIENDSVKFETHPDYADYGSKTYVYNNLTLPLTDFTEGEMAINGWKIDLSFCECNDMGFLTNYSLLGNNYDQLNVVIDNQSMVVDGSGMTYIYSESYGLVRYMTYGGFAISGRGWDLLGK